MGQSLKSENGESVPREVLELIAEARSTSLWFAPSDFVPADVPAAIRALEAIERHSNRELYVRARKLRAWLSHRFNARSAGASPHNE